MNALLYGLQVDFVTRNGHYMVLSAEGGLIREQLSNFQLNMLLANKIPHLLELQVEERDQQAKLYYNITGKKMLAHWLRMDNISIKQFYSLLYAIVNIVGESHIYMLQEGRYVLKEDYIYCGDDLADVQLTYIPKETLVEKNALSVDLQHLASRLIHKVSELSGSGYQELMSYLMEESFHIPVLKQLLLKHRNLLEQVRVAHKARNESLPSSLQRGSAQPQPTQSHAAWHSSNSTLNAADSTNVRPTPSSSSAALIGAASSASVLTAAIAEPSSVPPLSTQPQFSPSWFEEDDRQEAAETNKKHRLPVLLVGLLTLVLIWKLYLDHPTGGWLLICCGLSLLVIDLVFIVLKIWKPGAKTVDPATWESVHKALAQEGRQPQAASGLPPFFTPNTADYPVNPSAYEMEREAGGHELFEARLESRLDGLKQESGISRETDSYYKSLGQRTTVLSPVDATVLLSAFSLQPETRTAQQPYLEWNLNGLPKVVKLGKFPFVLGRAGFGVDMELELPGVSRMHAEITLENEHYMLKDLGSRNGTFINGEVLVPYRVYSLKEGDIVKLISTEFVFKMVGYESGLMPSISS